MNGIYVIALGEGKVGVGCVVSPDGKPGVFLRPLKEPVGIGGDLPTMENVDEGLFIQCPVLESALVLKRAVDELCNYLQQGVEK